LFSQFSMLKTTAICFQRNFSQTVFRCYTAEPLKRNRSELSGGDDWWRPQPQTPPFATSVNTINLRERCSRVCGFGLHRSSAVEGERSEASEVDDRWRPKPQTQPFATSVNAVNSRGRCDCVSSFGHLAAKTWCKP